MAFSLVFAATCLCRLACLTTGELPCTWRIFLQWAKFKQRTPNYWFTQILQVTALTLDANVSEYAAQTVFPRLPVSNSTAVEMDLQVSAAPASWSTLTEIM